eukprot:scaffold940_cov569-Prasinococcus_capsulatus_cf.AAC.16
MLPAKLLPRAGATARGPTPLRARAEAVRGWRGTARLFAGARACLRSPGGSFPTARRGPSGGSGGRLRPVLAWLAPPPHRASSRGSLGPIQAAADALYGTPAPPDGGGGRGLVTTYPAGCSL